uniref:Transthyretin-like family protein n=1 Tax=Syphacia muris TaxID=451379 RepID=A0A0N5ASB0_9BILA
MLGYSVWLSTILVAQIYIVTAWGNIAMYEARGRLLCNGKSHGKEGLAGWPKIIQFWNTEANVKVSLSAGHEEVNNRKGIFYIRGIERQGSPVALKVMHHCYPSPHKDCYQVDYIKIPEKYANRQYNIGNIELSRSSDVFETRTRHRCFPS